MTECAVLGIHPDARVTVNALSSDALRMGHPVFTDIFILTSCMVTGTALPIITRTKCLNIMVAVLTLAALVIGGMSFMLENDIPPPGFEQNPDGE